MIHKDGVDSKLEKLETSQETKHLDILRLGLTVSTK